MRTIKVVDLFCGAGGTTVGVERAIRDAGHRPSITAVNHWPVAIETHKQNHPESSHLCTGVDDINPRDLFEPGDLDILWASPECTHHSIARGGRPVSEQSRATAMCVIRWAEAITPKVILVENVREFLSWGPVIMKMVGGEKEIYPDPKRKGELFRAWVAMLEACGYRVDHRILCAADYGDPTTRERLFIQAVRTGRRIKWPNPTHGKGTPDSDLFGEKRKPWIGAKSVIDWADMGKSIYDRKNPLCAKTMERIRIGLEKFWLSPFIVPQHSGGPDQMRVRGMDAPLPTITTDGAHAIVTPFIVNACNGNGIGSDNDCRVHDIKDPLTTVTAGGKRHALISAFLVSTAHSGDHNESRVRSIEEPMPVVAGNRGDFGVVNPFLVRLRGGQDAASINEPVGTITSGGGHNALVRPFLVSIDHQGGNGGCTGDVDAPLSSVTTKQRHALLTPHLTSYYGNGGSTSVEEPAPTVTTKDRLGLVQPMLVKVDGEEFRLDILFRMLKPGELARAQGFPKDYKFSGNITQTVKQIGNAVPCGLAEALVRAVLAK